MYVGRGIISDNVIHLLKPYNYRKVYYQVKIFVDVKPLQSSSQMKNQPTATSTSNETANVDMNYLLWDIE